MKNVEKVIVEAIYDAKEGNNQDYKTLQLRVTKKVTNFLNDLLGSEGFDSSKVAFQSIHKDVLAAKGIVASEFDEEGKITKEGSNLGEALGRELRIVHSEATSQLDEGYRELINPTNDEPVTSGGEQMYFKRALGAATEEDTIISRDKAEVEAGAPIASEEAGA